MKAEPLPKSDKYVYIGGIHIHSSFSDGTGTVEEISLAAQKAGLEWIIITDHNSMEVNEGIYNGVCVIKGEEISPCDANHYLALGINQCIESNVPHAYVNHVRNQGGFGFAAHPFEGVNQKGQIRSNKHQPIKWTNRDIIPDGVEIWNWFSEWADNMSDKNIISLAWAYLFKHKLVFAPNQDAVNWWDDLNNKTEKIVPAIGGIDAHALKISKYIIPVTVFPYKDMFKTISNVVMLAEPLAGNFAKQKSLILKAVKNGNNLLINRKISEHIPVFMIKNKEEDVTSGGKIKIDCETFLKVETNKVRKIKVFYNGVCLWEQCAKTLELLIQKTGKYRVSIEEGNRTFVCFNPIIVY